MPSRTVGNGRKALPKCRAVDKMPSRRAESGREDIPEGRKWSGGPLVGPEVVGRPSSSAGSCQEAFPVDRERLEGLSKDRESREALRKVREWSGGTPG